MSKLKVTTIANVADSESTDVTNIINGSAKAWVNFNGTGTVAIRESFNVSSITDTATGDYTVNFTTAMADGNYAAIGTTIDNTNICNWSAAYMTSSGARFYVRNLASSPQDVDVSCVAIFR